MTLSRTLPQLGFDTTRLNFTLRTAGAACCAVMIAWLLGLEHPQWSGMTVWAASQPVRGQLLEKSVFRFIGTILGSLFGIFLLVISGGQNWMIVVGLSLWVGLCAGIGNILRGFVSYGVMLAGYSAAMVTLLHSAQAGSDLAIGIDRMLTVLVGVLVALAIGWIFADHGNQDEIAYRVRRLTRRILEDLAAYLAGTTPHHEREHHLLLAEMAAIEDQLDGHAAGSLRSREAIRAIRRLLSAQVATLLWMRRPRGPKDEGLLIEILQEAVHAFDMPDRSGTAVAALRRAADLASADHALSEVLAGLARSMAEQGAVAGQGVPVAGSAHLVVLHQDWVGAREALLRAGSVTLAAGLLWRMTGWEAGSFMMLGTAIMTTVFSIVDNPVQTMRYVVLGQIVGAAGALACRWLAWPLMSGELGLILSMMPFILLGGLIFAHRRTAIIGFDYNMVLLLLLQPAWPLTGSLDSSLTAAGAVILGPLIALFSYRLIFPIDGQRRLHTLMAMMVHEIEAMAARPDVSKHRAVWRARLYHRVLRLVRWAEKTGNSTEQVIGGSFAVLMLGSAILHMDELLRRPGQPPQITRRLKITLARLRSLAGGSQRAARTLTETAIRLANDPTVDHALLREAAAELSTQAGGWLTQRNARLHS